MDTRRKRSSRRSFCPRSQAPYVAKRMRRRELKTDAIRRARATQSTGWIPGQRSRSEPARVNREAELAVDSGGFRRLLLPERKQRDLGSAHGTITDQSLCDTPRDAERSAKKRPGPHRGVCFCGEAASASMANGQNWFQRNWLYTSWWNWTSWGLTKVPSRRGQRSAEACLRSAYRPLTSSPSSFVVQVALRKSSIAV